MNLPPADLTVVIPAYNNAAYLAEAVGSVRRQTMPPRRIIVIDDGSTDATPEVVAALQGDAQGAPIDYLRQDNAGPAAALNRGASMVGTELIAFQSSDDIWVPQKTEWQMQAMADGADLVFGLMQNFVSPELDPATAAGLQCPPEPMQGHNAGTLLTRLETFRRVGPLNEGFRIGEFIDWYGRALELKLRSVMLPQVVSMRRLHGRNHSLSRKTEAVGYAHVLKAMLDRRRASGGQT